MVDITILEYGVFAFFAYSSMLMLIMQTIKEPPSEKSGSIIRSIFLIPGIIAAFAIASSGQNVLFKDVADTVVALNTTEVWTHTVVTQLVLANPIWVTFHYLIGIIMIVYVFLQIITLFTKLK